MENTSTWVDIYLGKLFAGETVKIEDVFRKEEEMVQETRLKPRLEEAIQEKIMHS